MFGLDINCPRCKACTLKNDRTNLSKNKLMFTIFVMDAPPYVVHDYVDGVLLLPAPS